MAKPKLLDLFCKAGGASMGYHLAGFDVTGVDIEPQPNYPFRFIQADALAFPLEGYDTYHASPPCQRFSIGTQRWSPLEYPDLVDPIRQRLMGTGRPWIIENVPGAPVRQDVVLTGVMFGLRLVRRRHFESNVLLLSPQWVPIKGSVKAGDYVTVAGHGGNGSNRKADWIEAMGIDWMAKKEMAQAIPPAYTEFIGRQLMAYVREG